LALAAKKLNVPLLLRGGLMKVKGERSYFFYRAIDKSGTNYRAGEY
jgi:hypothetical protein